MKPQSVGHWLCVAIAACMGNWIQVSAQVPAVAQASAQAAATYLVGDNVTVSNAIFYGSGVQLAKFSNGTNTVGFSNGILLTTCDAAFAGTPNDCTPEGNGSYGLNTGIGDPDLDLLNGPGTARDAAFLEFDFVTSNTTIGFDFVFASKEHNGWALSGFNDAFGFFISGPGINGPFTNNAQNIALINGVPATVNNVNAGLNSSYIVTQGCPGIGVQDPNNPSTWWFAWERWTIPVTGSIAVQCNTTYHAKIAICNTSDNLFHSGVFLRKGTLDSPYSSPGPLTVAPSPQCEGQPLTLNVVGDPSWTYTWSTGQSGVGLQQITTPAVLGVNSYSVTAEYLPGCTLSGSSLVGDVVVHSSNNIPPSCLGINGSGNYQAYVQAGDQLCFQIPTSDTPNEEVVISWNGGAPGTFSSNGGYQAIGTYCWTPTLNDVGTYSFSVSATDNNACDVQSSGCIFNIKVVCDFCPISVFYENRTTGGLPLPELTEAGWRIVAGTDVDPNQTNGPVETGTANVEFRAPEVLLEPGFVAGPNFLAVPDPNTCLEACDECCDDWQGFTVDTYDGDGDGEYDDLINVFSPNGDGVNDYWMVLDQDHPFCAYGAQAFELFIRSPGSSPVWYLQSSPDGCCPFESKAPNNPIPHSSIYWDGTVNTGFLSCNGCPAPTGTYYYVLHLWGCNGSVTYTGYFEMFRSMVPAGNGVHASNVIEESSEFERKSEVLAETLPKPAGALLFPNPGSDIITLVAGYDIQEIVVYDLLGRKILVYSGTVASRIELWVDSWAKGNYVFTIRSSNGTVERINFVKS